MAFPPNAAKLAAYRSTAVHSGVDAADPHRLIVMLMDGALERIATARGLMKHGGGAEKAQLLHRAVAIIDELRNSLEFQGGRRHSPPTSTRCTNTCASASCRRMPRTSPSGSTKSAACWAKSAPPGCSSAQNASQAASAMSVTRLARRGAPASAPGAQLARAGGAAESATAAGVASPPRFSPAPGISSRYLCEQRWGRVDEELERAARAARPHARHAARCRWPSLPALARRSGARVGTRHRRDDGQKPLDFRWDWPLLSQVRACRRQRHHRHLRQAGLRRPAAGSLAAASRARSTTSPRSISPNATCACCRPAMRSKNTGSSTNPTTNPRTRRICAASISS